MSWHIYQIKYLYRALLRIGAVCERVSEHVVVIAIKNAGNHQFSKVSDPGYFLFKATRVEYV